LAGVVLVAAPFVLSSLAIDGHGIEVTGSVYSKHEYVSTRYSTWARTSEMTVEYWPPDGSSVRFFTTKLEPADYDSFAKGQRVTIHYLRRSDIPKISFAETLGRMQMLPVARLGGRTALSGIKDFLSAPVRFMLLWIGAVVALLIVWRVAHVPRFAWAVALCVLVTLGGTLVSDFPRPTPAPAAPTLQATARVQSIETIQWLFRGTRSRGIEAAQPIQVLALEFVPAGRTEPVVAIDLIDAGSIPGIRQDAKLSLDYEVSTPRTAHVRGATRNFVPRNIRGIGFQIVAVIAVIGGLLLFANWLGGAWNRLLARR
jgi:hypothetical protein